MSLQNGHTVPLVDLSPFTSGGSLKDCQKASQALWDACHSLGFASIVGHGVPDGLLREAFSWTKKLFDLPHDEKMKAPHPASSIPHRGYSPPGLEKVYSKEDLDGATARGQESSLRKVQDFKESYEIGSENNPPQTNVWLPEDILPGFREFTTKFYWELNKAAQVILEAVSLGLNLTEDEKAKFIKLHSGHNNQLRLLHYPPIEAEKMKNQVAGRMPAHQDWSSFTFLFQDDVGGLELEDPHHRGTFSPANPIPGACVLNVGDMLERFTNRIFPSAMHRVTLPPLQPNSDPKDSKGVTKARYSIPYFVAPDHDAIVESLRSCVTADHPVQYKPVKFSDYGDYIAKYMYVDDEGRKEEKK